MELPKYAKLENERRFWVESLQGLNLDKLRHLRIDDRYLHDTRMRVRAVTSAEGTHTYKLCKKYPTNDSYSGAIVNVYLSQVEYALFCTLPGATLSKRRYTVKIGPTEFGINVFEGALHGLILCEAEQPAREQLTDLQFPDWATKDVTEDDFFQGGHLSQISGAQLQEKLSQFKF